MALRETLERARSHPATGSEEAAKVRIVLPILSALGWDYTDPSHVDFEYSVGTRRQRGQVDIALREPRDANVALIEVKAPAKKLDEFVEQLMEYAFNDTAGICVLTTGLVWWLYLPHSADAKPSERRFAQLDVVHDSIDQLIDDFETYLSRPALLNRSAQERAQQALDASLQEERLLSEIPRVWRQMIDEPDHDLVQLIENRVFRSVRLRPTADQITAALRGDSPVMPSAPDEKTTGKRRKVSGRSYRCSKCGETKPGDDFYWRSSGRRLSACKVCQKKPKASPQRQNAERDAEIVRLRNDGSTFSSIARRFDLSHVRVRKIYLRETEGRTQQAPPRPQSPGGQPSRSPLRHSKAPRRRVVGFVLLGEQHVAASWKDVWLGVAGVLYTRHTANFDHAMRLRGTSRQYIARSEEELFRARRIGTSPYFAEINFSAGDCARHSRALLELFGYRGDDLEVLEE